MFIGFTCTMYLGNFYTKHSSCAVRKQLQLRIPAENCCCIFRANAVSDQTQKCSNVKIGEKVNVTCLICYEDSVTFSSCEAHFRLLLMCL